MVNYDINSKKWKKYRLRYLNPDGTKKFKMPDATLNLLLSDPKKFKSYCNGVGSTRGRLGKLTYHFIPNTIWFMSITPASDLHDVDYSIPAEFDTIEHALEYKRQADIRIRQNIDILADRAGGWFEQLRHIRAFEYYEVLKSCGTDSFLADKVILNNLTA